MPNEKKPDFVVNDRRKFNIEGEPIPETKEPEAKPQEPAAPTGGPQLVTPAQEQQEQKKPAGPTASEKTEQASRYGERSRDIDARLQRELDTQGGGRKLSDFEMTFDKLVASLYMTALMQLGLISPEGQHQEGPQRADIIGARQTIDTLSILHDKTKGNLTEDEETVLSNCLYELRMAYIEVTNAITRTPPASPNPGSGLK